MTGQQDQPARARTSVRRDYKGALRALVSWQEDCLNCGLPEDRKAARTIPDDNDLCELFNRIDRARKLLAPTPTR